MELCPHSQPNLHHFLSRPLYITGPISGIASSQLPQSIGSLRHRMWKFDSIKDPIFVTIQ